MGEITGIIDSIRRQEELGKFDDFEYKQTEKRIGILSVDHLSVPDSQMNELRLLGLNEGDQYLSLHFPKIKGEQPGPKRLTQLAHDSFQALAQYILRNREDRGDAFNPQFIVGGTSYQLAQASMRFGFTVKPALYMKGIGDRQPSLMVLSESERPKKGEASDIRGFMYIKTEDFLNRYQNPRKDL